MLNHRNILPLSLVCINISFCLRVPLRETGYKENYNDVYGLKVEPNSKIKTGTGFKNRKEVPELNERYRHEDVYGFVLRPDWKVKSSRTESYSYEGFVREEGSNLNSAEDVHQQKNLQMRSVDLRITRRQETCFHTAQNEIANLFYEDIDISKKIFPLCCKTETKCKPKTTECMSVLRTLPRPTQKRQQLTLPPKKTTNTLKQVIPTSVQHSISNEAVVNVVIHVKCDHPEAREHVVPNTMSLYPPFNCMVTRNATRLDFQDSKYNFSVNIINTKTTEVAKYSLFKTDDILNNTKIDEGPYIKKYEYVSFNDCSDDKLFGEQDTTTEDRPKEDFKMKFPQPLLPHDITIKITQPTHKPKTTNLPSFICQITPRFCKFTSLKAGALTRRGKPGFTLWKKISLPHFWQSIPTTKNNSFPETDRETVETTCRNEKSEDQTTEENVLDRVPCLPDMNVTEDPSVNNCEVSDFEITESVNCEPIFKNTEQSNPSNFMQEETTGSALKFGQFPIPCALDITRPVLPVKPNPLANKDLDQTLSEPWGSDPNVNKESYQSSKEWEEPSTEPLQSEPGNGQSLTEADQLVTEYFSPSVTLVQPDVQPRKTPKAVEKLNTDPGQGLAKNVVQSNTQEKTSVHNGDYGIPPPEYANVMTTPSNQNVRTPEHLSTYLSKPFTGPDSLFFLKTSLPQQTEELMVSSITEHGLLSIPKDDESTTVYSLSLHPLDKVNSTALVDILTNHVVDESPHGYISSDSINQAIESGQPITSTSASEAASETLNVINENNNETTISNPGSLTMIDNRLTNAPVEVSNQSVVEVEDISLPTTFDILKLKTLNQTESGVSVLLIQDSSTIDNLSNKFDEAGIKHIIDLNNNGFLFYRNHKWLISNTNHLWGFDDGTVEIVNDTFIKISTEHSEDNNEKNKDTINHMFGQKGVYNESEEVPFEIFVQAVLLYSEYNHGVSTFEWSGIYLNLNEMIAMLRITNFDSFHDGEWGSVNWMTIYRLVKESAKSTSQDKNEYNITEADGSIQSLIVFLNGSSTWKNIKHESSEVLNIIKKLNSESHFFKQKIHVPYQSYDPSFMSFLKNVFHQRVNSNITYSEYVWEDSTYNWDEILSLIVMLNTILTDITNLETSMRQSWDGLLVKFRNSKRHCYIDRTVYDIGFDTGLKSMTVFTNETIDFDGKRITLAEVAQRVSDFTVPKVPTSEVRHIIDLGGGKFQFYWRNKWYITNYIRTWSFEEQTNALMNESFFRLPEDLTASRESIEKLLVESSYNSHYEMPFELFAQSMLTAAKYSRDTLYQWSGYSLSYADITVMLRLSNFNNFQVLGYRWGQVNWHAIYDKVIQSPKTSSAELQAYEMLDYDGYIYPLIVFSNGTSIWKHSKLDLAESLATLKNLNMESHFPDVISVSSYISNADSFLSFITAAIEDRITNKILHSFYNWKNYQFTWEDLVAINRILLHHYELKLAHDLSFSNIALPILNSTKHVFPNRTEFQVISGSETKLLIVYPNGTTKYDNVRSEFMDTVKKLEYLKQSSNMVFKEDWSSEVDRVKEVPNSSEKVHHIYSKGGSHSYDWKQLNNNPFFNVCYPINLGGGKVQFYMKNTWFITDGEHIWPFEDSLTSFYINEMAKAMNQTFTDDPNLDKPTIQNLVDSKQTLKGLEDLVMPHELMIQHYLFFMKQLDRHVAFNISQDIIYQREKVHIKSVQLMHALRLSAFNKFTTKEVELPWEKGKKLNWDWFFFMGRRSERIQILEEWTDALNTSYFDEFRDTPLLVVYSNFSSDWGGQLLDLDEALLKIRKANEHNSFVPVVVNGELTSNNESFEWLYKEALKNRFENKRTYFKYKWLTESVSWFDILIVLRFTEVKPEAVHDNMFWKNSIKEITRGWKNRYSDRIEYEVSGIDSNKDIILTIYMNESTVFNGKKMDIEEYRILL